MKDIRDWKRIQDIIDNSVPNGNLSMWKNSELCMFYLSQFMQENVFFRR